MSRRTTVPDGGWPSSSTSSSAADSKDKGQSKQQALLLTQNTGHFSMIRALHLADLITTMNCLCGVLSIFSCLRYCLSCTFIPGTSLTLSATTLGDQSWLWASLVFMPLGLFFDFFDGRVARWRQKSSLMGQELDSLADLVSFGVAPASFAWTIGMRTPIDSAVLVFFVLCGLCRLARFNVTVASLPKDKSGKSSYFEGTPIPMSLGIITYLGVCVSKQWVEGGAGLPFGTIDLGLGEWGSIHPVVGLYALHGCTMVSRSLKIPKP